MVFVLITSSLLQGSFFENKNIHHLCFRPLCVYINDRRVFCVCLFSTNPRALSTEDSIYNHYPLGITLSSSGPNVTRRSTHQIVTFLCFCPPSQELFLKQEVEFLFRIPCNFLHCPEDNAAYAPSDNGTLKPPVLILICCPELNACQSKRSS